MNTEILELLRTVTAERDVDSLEMTLVLTLVERIKCHRVVLYEVSPDYLDKTLEITYDQQGNLQVNTKRRNLSNKELHAKLLGSSHPIYFPNEDSIQHILTPLIVEENVSAAIEVFAAEDLSQKAVELSIFFDIYRNYLSVLRESERDQLTGLYNRKTFDQKLNRLLQVQKEHQRPSAATSPTAPLSHWLIVLDIDHFKTVNDQYGHVCGDEVLLALANLLAISARREDLMFRFGGEEFVIILAPCSLEEAENVLLRLKHCIAKHRFPLVGSLTVSMGFEEINPDDFPMQVFERADMALYYVKNNGRNAFQRYRTLVDTKAITPIASDRKNNIDLF